MENQARSASHFTKAEDNVWSNLENCWRIEVGGGSRFVNMYNRSQPSVTLPVSYSSVEAQSGAN